MSSITIHQLDPQLDVAIRQFAEERQMSLNKSIQQLLRKALGLTSSAKKNDFSQFSGVWNEDEFEKFQQNVKSLSKIHSKDWSV